MASMTELHSGKTGTAKAQPRLSSRVMAICLTLSAGGFLAACQSTSTTDLIRVEREQGSEENIASLSSVIAANPRDPEAYNVRGSAYGRAGQFRSALEDFDQAIQLNPRFYQAYANRALVHRNMGNPSAAAADYNMALQLSPNYDVAYIGRGNLCLLYTSTLPTICSV